MSRGIESVRIVEVGPRDGLQNVKTVVATDTKVELIQRLYSAGLQTVEITSVVSPRAIPQLSDCRTVLSNPFVQKCFQNALVRAPVLVPNLKGLQLAIQQNVKEVAVFVSASEGFSRANINCSVQQGLDRAKAVAEESRKHGIAVRGYVSCIFSCPYDGKTPFTAVLKCVRQLLDMGCYEISLGDTVGVGVASHVQRLLMGLVEAGVPIAKLAGHFHDTYGQAVANIWAAYQCGVRVFDSSVGGLGGCPYAPGAKGNVATEDVVYMFEEAGIKTGVDLASVAQIGVWISEKLNKQNESRAGSALVAKGITKSPSSPSMKERSNSTPKLERLKWVSYASSEGLNIVRSGTNIKIILDRPQNGNALTTAMISSITKIFTDAATESSITRIVITATGKYFCTGMDLARGSTLVSQGESASSAQYKQLTKLFEAIDNSPQVTIACVQGPAFGGGVGLAFACDIRLMVKNATMTLSEVKLGLCPATISKYVIREWGPAFAREALLRARPVTPSELLRLGTVSLVAETESDLAVSLDQYLNRLKIAAPRASSMGKELVRLSWRDGGGGQKQADGIRELFNEMMAGSSETAVGLKQFQEGNRPMDWDAYTLGTSDPKPKL